MDAYKKHGFKDRKDYLRTVANDYDVDEDVVYTLADMLPTQF